MDLQGCRPSSWSSVHDIISDHNSLSTLGTLTLNSRQARSTHFESPVILYA
jgi:hypothetical protein